MQMIKIIRTVFLALGLIGTSIGFVFKVQHWPYQKAIFSAGTICIFLFIALEFYLGYKKKEL